MRKEMGTMNTHLDVANTISASRARHDRHAFLLAVLQKERPGYRLLLHSVCWEELRGDFGDGCEEIGSLNKDGMADSGTNEDGTDLFNN